MSDASFRGTGWRWVAAVVAFAAPFLVAWFVLPYALIRYIRWKDDYGQNESPEVLADLTMMVASPFLLFLCLAVGYVLGGLAFGIVSRRLAQTSDGSSKRH